MLLFLILMGLVLFTAGYFIGRHGAKGTGAPSVPANAPAYDAAYDAAYPSHEREADRRRLELMDEFAKLQRERNGLIRKAQLEGIQLLEGDTMKAIKIRTLVCLEQLIEYEPAGFYKDLYDELLAEQAALDEPVQ